MKILYAMAGAMLLLVSCKGKDGGYDATGTFEATETTVFAEQNGSLLCFDVQEGVELAQGQEVALIDTTQLYLGLQQLLSTRNVYRSQKPDREKQIASTRQQLAKALQEEQRFKELVADGAAPSKTLDDASSQVLVLQKQLDAQISTLNTQLSTLDSQMLSVDAQVDVISDQLAKCHVVAPLSGTVLEKYTERGEFVTVGRPLFKMADMENVFLRAYVTSAQLQKVRLGQKVEVFADYGDGGRQAYEGTVGWISSQSQFTPKTILTDDERADLVYAVKIAVRNDGYLKIGMYGGVKLD